jgi:integrase/recombinase XerD
MSENLYQRNGIWWARFKVAGVEYRRSLRTRVRSATAKRLKAVRKQIEDEAHFGILAPMSWPAAVVGWNENGTSTLGAATVKRYKVSLKQMRPFLDHMMVHEIDGTVLKDIVKARRAQFVSIATIRRDLTAVSSVLDNAADEEWIDENPVLPFLHRRRKKNSLREKHEPIVLPDEPSIAMMLEVSPTRFADAQEFARETGMRQEEIFSLGHNMLNARDGIITMVGKGRKLRVIPYTAKAQAIVARQPQFIGSNFVFWHDEGKRWRSPGSRFTDIRRRVLRKAQKAAHFTPYRFHDLRHLFAVEYLRSQKGSIYDLKELLGHASIKTTERYLEYLTPEEKKFAMHGAAQNGAQKQRSGGSK